MKTEAITFLDGRIELHVQKFKSPEGDPCAVLVVKERGLNCGIFPSTVFHLLEEDAYTIEDAVAAFNEVMRRPALQDAAE